MLAQSSQRPCPRYNQSMNVPSAQQGTGLATLITVHGTFVTGPLEGRAWWQYCSASTMRLAMLLQADDGRITLDPFVWNGLNSELSRRAAGQGLPKSCSRLNAAANLTSSTVTATAARSSVRRFSKVHVLATRLTTGSAGSRSVRLSSSRTTSPSFLAPRYFREGGLSHPPDLHGARRTGGFCWRRQTRVA